MRSYFQINRESSDLYGGVSVIGRSTMTLTASMCMYDL